MAVSSNTASRYLPRFFLGAALLLARRPTLLAPLARAWRVNLARAAFCLVIAIRSTPTFRCSGLSYQGGE
jgi:hypothetical protein